MSRVLIANWRDPWHPEGGGSELYVQEVATRLAAVGHEVTVFTARYPGAAAEEVRDGVRFRRRGGHLTVYLWFLILLATGRFGAIDAVLETQNGMPFLATLATRGRVVVLVHHVHREQWPVVGPILARIGWFMESRVAVRCNRGNRYVAVSEVTAAELVALGVRVDDITIAHNGLPRAPEQELPPRSATPRLAVLSRLVPHKQIEHAIALMPRLLTEFPDATLIVMGSGWWTEELLALRDRLGLAAHVEFLGHVTDETKYAELARAWVHVLPSVKEGWGLSVMEAASVGTPSVAYRRAGGVRESIVDEVTGLLAEDEEDLTHAVLRLVREGDLRDKHGLAAQARSAEFDWSTTAERIAEALGVAFTRQPLPDRSSI